MLMTSKSKKRAILIIVFCFVLIFAGCMPIPAAASQDSEQPSSVSTSDVSFSESITVEILAKDQNAQVGEYNTPYNYETSIVGADGKTYEINSFSVVSVKKTDSFEAGQETLKNVVVVEVVGDYDSLFDYLSNKAFCSSFDASGKQNTDFGSAVYRDRTNDTLFLLFDSGASITDAHYFMLGGLASEKNNGFSKILYEIE